ncbi:MAG: inositol monophosphatase family protein [Candidatus Latescibacterota bacterium]|nr:inositol monophosphatase family protein [Candidatus Latescibacterota bacterium]
MNALQIDPDWVVDLTRRAGEIAISYFGKTTGQLKPDRSWVTKADLAIEEFLRAAITEVRPQDAIIGEEGDKKVNPDAEYVWALDPIDGTRMFNHGLPVWGISVGILRDGIPYLGAFLLPALGDIYHTDSVNAFLNGTRLSKPDPRIDENAIFLISEGAYKIGSIDYLGKVISLGSAAAHICYVARGSAVGAMDKAGIWDYAAGSAILRAQDIRSRYLSGIEVDFTALYGGHAVAEPTLMAHDSCFETLQTAAGFLDGT